MQTDFRILQHKHNKEHVKCMYIALSIDCDIHPLSLTHTHTPLPQENVKFMYIVLNIDCDIHPLHVSLTHTNTQTQSHARKHTHTPLPQTKHRL